MNEDIFNALSGIAEELSITRRTGWLKLPSGYALNLANILYVMPVAIPMYGSSKHDREIRIQFAGLNESIPFYGADIEAIQRAVRS